MTRDQFYKELLHLTERFEQLKPECEAVLRSPEAGVEGYLVVWNTAISRTGPLKYCAKGGTRISPTVSLDEIRMLARIMSIKNAAANLPLGGAKSGMCADPASPGFEKQYRTFVRLAKPLLTENGGPYGGFGFDIGARPEHARWACDELGTTKSFTGKPRDLGGTDYDKEGIAGIGVAQAALTLLESSQTQASKCTFAVQGLGNVGAAVVRDLHAAGAKITHISDLRIGGTYAFPGGVEKDLIEPIAQQHFSAVAAALKKTGVQPAGVDEVLYAKVDVLLPCAIQNVLRADNASKVQAAFIVEGANNPCTPQARETFNAAGKLLIPDFIANPGGIIAAYTELCLAHGVLDAAGPAEAIAIAVDRTRKTIAANVAAIFSLASAQRVEPLSAAKHLALSRLFGGIS